jgi:plasmid replication initiation protein
MNEEIPKTSVHVGLVNCYVDAEATVKLICSIVIPLITRLEEQFTQYDIEQISDLSVLCNSFV